MFAKIQNGVCIRFQMLVADIRQENPGVNLPDNWQGGVVGEFEYVQVVEVPLPDHDSWTQTAVQVTPVFSDNQWIEVWEVRDLPEIVIASLRKTESDIAINLRKELLQSTDWTQLPDVPLSSTEKADWATYRQQLRDITLQQGYPIGIVWPTAPGQQDDVGVTRVD